MDKNKLMFYGIGYLSCFQIFIFCGLGVFKKKKRKKKKKKLYMCENLKDTLKTVEIAYILL